MKQILFIVLATVLGATGIQAQRHAHHPRHDRMDKLDSVVNLTEAQKAELKSIHDNFKVEVREARQAEDRDKLKTLREEHKRSIDEVLTDEQKAILKEYRVEERGKHKAFRDEVKAYRKSNIKPYLKEARTSFDEQLSEEEKGKIAVLRTKLQEQRKAHKADCSGHKKGTCSKEARKAMRSEVRQELQPIVDAHKAELETIATSMKEKRAEWKSDIDDIRAKHGVTETHARKPGKMKKAKHDGGKHKQGFAYRFLLMNT